MNEKEFTDFVNSTKAIVLKAIQKYLKAEFASSIDDVVQETYLRAFKAIRQNKFRSESSLSTWLYTIAKNECFRYNEKLTKELKNTEEMNEDVFEISSNGENGWAKETAQYIKEVVKKLPAKYRSVMELDILGYRDKQIAEMLNISAGTVKSRNSRARDMIRQIASQEGSIR